MDPGSALSHDMIDKTTEKLTSTTYLALDSYRWTQEILAIPQIDTNRQKYLHHDTSCFLSKKINTLLKTHSQHSRENKGFTLIEVLVSVVLTGVILTSAFSGFQGIMKSQIRLSGVINIQRSLFYLNEKLSSLINTGGTIDYEEYFNRRMLGYEKSFSAENIWTYTRESKYGNGDNIAGRPKLYLCGKDTTTDEDACLGTNSVSIAPNETSFTETLLVAGNPKQMAFGQYREIGFNYASLS